MTFSKFLAFFCLLVTTLSTAQNKAISLDDIWKNGTFRSERLDALHSMNNGQEYSVLNFDRQNGTTTIDIYDYKTLEKVKEYESSKKFIYVKVSDTPRTFKRIKVK